MTDWPIAPRRKFTPDELAQITSVTVDRLHAMLPDLTAGEWEDGRTWYVAAHGTARGMARLYGCGTSTAAAVIAALSPRIAWETNVDEAHECFVYGDDWGYAALRANVDKALDIIAGSDPEDRLGGRKVRSFYRNIIDPYGSLDVTLDGWMATALDLPLYDNGNVPILQRKGGYDAVAEGFRLVADELGVMPHQLQATVWLHHRHGKVGG